MRHKKWFIIPVVIAVIGVLAYEAKHIWIDNPS